MSSDKILNPKTGRMVNRNGTIGKELLATIAKEKLNAIPEHNVELNYDALNIIANKTSPNTKKTLRSVNKHFRNTLPKTESIGHNNYNKLMTFIKYEDNDKLTLTIYNKNQDTPKLHIEKTPGKVLFIRHRPGEIDDIIGTYKYTKRKELNDFELNNVIKPRNKTFVAKFINNMNDVYTGYHDRNSIFISNWNKELSSKK